MLRKKLTLAVASLATAIAPITGPLSSFVGARTASVAAAAALLPMTASAQSGKRICGDGWTNFDGAKVGFIVEVYKWDFVTCTGFVVTFEAIMGAWTIEELAKSYFSSTVNTIRTTRPGPSVMRTCESFTNGNLSGKFGGDVCNSMKDYKIYAYFNAYGKTGISRF